MALLCLTRTSLIATLYIQQKNQNNDAVQEEIGHMITTLLSIYLILIYLGVVLSIFFFTVETGKFVRSCIKNPRAKTKPEK